MRRTILFSIILTAISVHGIILAQEIEYVGSTPWPGILDVKVSGDYAFCASSGGLIVLDISNNSAPILIRQLYLPDGAKLFIDRNLVFFARGSYGLDIIDVTEPENPLVIGHNGAPLHAHDVYVQGNYAYVADDSSGLIVINVSDPSLPTLAGCISTPGSAEGIFVAGGYAYIADGNLGALQIINVEDPTNPTRAGVFNDSLYNPTNVFIDSNYAYVANFPSDFVIVDVSTPALPSRVARAWWPINCHDIFVSGNYAYAACQDFGLEVYDITNPQSPGLIGSCDTLGELLTMDISGGLAYLTDLENGMHIIDISQPTTPVLTGNYDVGTNFRLVAVSGGYAFLGDNQAGISIVDITEPSHPSIIGAFDTLDAAQDLFAQGSLLYALVWETNFTGLRIFDISTPAAPVLLSSYRSNFWKGELSNGYFYIVHGEHSLEIIDVHDPAQPQLVGAYDIGDTVVYDVAVNGDYAFLSGGLLRHRILNVSDPANPSFVGFFLTTSPIRSTLVLGDFLYATSLVDSIFVIDISDPLVPMQVGQTALGRRGFYSFDIAIENSYLFAYAIGMKTRVFDINNPSSPAFIDSLSFSAGDIAFSDEYLYEASGPLSIWRLRLTRMEGEDGQVPQAPSLSQNYPNPFNASTIISYSLPPGSQGTISIYDILGRAVRRLEISGTRNQVLWDGLDDSGQPVASGLYFYRIDNHPETSRKMLLLR